jgi:hypothetical protein
MQTTWRKNTASEYDLLNADGETLAWIVRKASDRWLWYMVDGTDRGGEANRVAAMRAVEREAGVKA